MSLSRQLKAPRAPSGTSGPYHVFHHVWGKEQAPKLYKTQTVELMGAFVHFVDDEGQEVWLSGNLTIRPVRVKEAR